MKKHPGVLRANLLRPEDIPGYRSAPNKEPIKDEEKSYTLEDGTVIVLKKTHIRRETLLECIDDFPDAIQKIVAPYL